MNEYYLKQLNSGNSIEIGVYNVLAVEMDEMWSFCQNKSQQIWLWWAVDHATNTPLAYTFGTRKHKYLVKLLKLLKPFNISTVFSDYNYAYHDKIPPEQLITGKRNTQQIERHHLTLRTRIKRLCRKSICFSKDKTIHKSIIGTFINTHFFKREFSFIN